MKKTRNSGPMGKGWRRELSNRGNPEEIRRGRLKDRGAERHRNRGMYKGLSCGEELLMIIQTNGSIMDGVGKG